MNSKSIPVPRTLRLQPSAFTDHITDDGHELTKLPYPFYVYETGRVALQRFWHGSVLSVIGFQTDLAEHVIDVPWREVWQQPEKAVGLYVVTADNKGGWAVQSTAISSAVMSEQSQQTVTRDEVVTVALSGVELRTVGEIHEDLLSDGWNWPKESTQRVLDRLVSKGVAVHVMRGRYRSFKLAAAVS